MRGVQLFKIVTKLERPLHEGHSSYRLRTQKRTIGLKNPQQQPKLVTSFIFFWGGGTKIFYSHIKKIFMLLYDDFLFMKTRKVSRKHLENSSYFRTQWEVKEGIDYSYALHRIFTSPDRCLNGSICYRPLCKLHAFEKPRKEFLGKD